MPQLRSIDDILASKLRASNDKANPKQQRRDSQYKKNSQDQPKGRRTLEKFKFEEATDGNKLRIGKTNINTNELLENEEDEALGSQFDQFKGRKTDFSMDIYSVNMPAEVSSELRARADRVEADINKSKRAAGGLDEE